MAVEKKGSKWDSPGEQVRHYKACIANPSENHRVFVGHARPRQPFRGGMVLQ